MTHELVRAPIRVGRVVLAALAAGVAMNVVDGLVNTVLLRADFEAHLAKMGAADRAGAVVAFWVTVDFVYATAVVALNLAMRPRYGRGPACYLRAACAVWCVGYLSAAGPIVEGALPLSFHLTGTLFAIASFGLGAFLSDRVYGD
jgi:hypothetical protein